MKLALHELRRGARRPCIDDELPPAFKMLARVSRIMEQLVQAWNVLSTMTPSEYTACGRISAVRRASSRTSTARSSSCSATRMRRCAAAWSTAGDAQAHLKTRAERALASTTRRSACSRARASTSIRRSDDPDGPRPFDDAVEAAWLDGLSGSAASLGALRARRGTDRSRGRVPAVALPACDDGRAHHRLQARHRRHRRRQLPAQDARRRAVPRTLEGSHRPLIVAASTNMHPLEGRTRRHVDNKILQPEGWA